MVSGEIVRFTIHHERTGASASQNVYTAEYGGGSVSDGVFMLNLSEWLLEEDGYLDIWASIASSQVTADRLTAAVIERDGTVVRNLPERVLDVDGEVLFDSMAAATSGQIRFETATPGHRGMKYIPGIADPRVNLGLLDATAVVALIDLGLKILELDAQGGGLQMAIGALDLLAEVFRPFVVSSATSINPIYQRRRGPGRGV